MIICAEALATLRDMPSCSIDALVTDPPAGISFMGRTWDGDKGGRDEWIRWLAEIMREAYRVLKPGAHGLVWALPRTSHWTAMALEDAGFEIRDSVQHLFGQGFPKSLDVGKQLDLREKTRWLDVSKAIDKMAVDDMMSEWIAYSSIAKLAAQRSLTILKRDGRTTGPGNTAPPHAPTKGYLAKSERITPSASSRATFAEPAFPKSTTETGTNTLKSGSAPALVMLSVSPENSLASALLAELVLSDPPHWCEASSPSVPSLAGEPTTALSGLATDVAPSRASHDAIPDIPVSSVPWLALGFLDARTSHMEAAVEALMTWLGSERYSKPAAFAALCAALTDALKRTILNRSKTFLNLDTTSQTACVSAINATTTEYTAASLISFTAAILKAKAIDNAAGAERDVVGTTRGGVKPGGNFSNGSIPEHEKWHHVTAPATEAAREWEGFGTALKPAAEVWILVRKPCSEKTVAANVLRWGCGALNIDASRVRTTLDEREQMRKMSEGFVGKPMGSTHFNYGYESSMPLKTLSEPHTLGRWPSNVLISHLPECQPTGTRVVRGDQREGRDVRRDGGFVDTGAQNGSGVPNGAVYGNETVTAFECAEGCAVRELDRQSGMLKSGPMTRDYLRNKDTASLDLGVSHSVHRTDGDTGGASRFFTTFRYVAKPSTSEKNAGLGVEGAERNIHSTIKGVSLMRWLCRLVTQPGGTVLDCFAGSGTTGVAAILEGFAFVGIEREPEYARIAEARLLHASDEDDDPQLVLFPEDKPKPKIVDPPLTLF